MLALEARRRAEAEVAEAAKAEVEAAKAAADAEEAMNVGDRSSLPPSPTPLPRSISPPLVTPSTSTSISRGPSIPESSAKGVGRRVRKLTQFGEMHAKQIEDAKAKATKMKAKKGQAKEGG
jgi:hypothetical protein